MPIQLISYTGDPIPNEELLSSLNLQNASFTYIVATNEMEYQRSRLDFWIPSHQWEKASQTKPRAPKLVFHKVLRLFLPRPPISRAEERVLITRAIKLAASNPRLEQQIRHDVFAWRDALTRLSEENLDLRLGIPDELLEQLVSVQAGDTLRLLQTHYLECQAEADERPFEEAVRRFLQAGYDPTPYIVMEGFTYLTPLQELYVEQCLSRRRDVLFVYPYSARQRYGFARLERTYLPFKSRTEVTSREEKTAVRARPPCLVHLYKNLFGQTTEDYKSSETDPETVTLEAFSHRHEEVAACIRRIQAYIDAGRSPSDMAIVTRTPQGFHTLLREEQELQGLTVDLGILPRQLLLTPIGRFILALYEIWGESALQLNADQFEAILASGWLGADFQRTVERFNAVKEQLFTRCNTREDWQLALGSLRQLLSSLPEDSRLPAKGVSSSVVELWESALEQVEAISRRLFDEGTYSIQEHIQRLQDELSQLEPEMMLKKEREVVERIREVFEQLSSGTSLRMTPLEFQQVLNSLIQETEDRRAAEEQERERNKGERIWLTSPEGIDGTHVSIVFYLGLDNQRVPRPYQDPWPFYSNDIAAHQETERYLFLAVVRATTETLHCSYAQLDEAGTYRASPYLEQVAELIGQEIVRPEEQEGLEEEAALPAEIIGQGRTRRKNYTVSEIAHFALCPYRYKLERLDRCARHYTNGYQERILVQGIWLGYTFEEAANQGMQAKGAQQVYGALQVAMANVEQRIQQTFLGLDELAWYNARKWVKRRLRSLANTYKQAEVRILKGSTQLLARYILEDSRSTVIKAQPNYVIQHGDDRKPLLRDLYYEEWLLTSRQQGDRFRNVANLRLFASQYHAAQWWQTVMEAAFTPASPEYRKMKQELAAWVEQLETGVYPKHPGDHCVFCPVRATCFGLEEDR